MDQDPTFFTVKELANLLRLKERKVYDLAATGAVPCARATGKLLFPKQEIHAWIAENSSGGSIDLPPRPSIFLGSHDPLLDWAIRQSRCDLATFCDGALDGLRRFAAREGIVAGLHLYDSASQDWNIPQVAQNSGARQSVLLGFAKRRRGLILRPGLTHLSGFADLPGRRIAPRQPESGSEILFQVLAQEAGVDTSALEFGPVTRTETEAAQALARGQADVAFGLEAVARDFSLGFVPVIEEQFDLLIDRRAWFDPPLQSFWAFCQSGALEAQAALLGGYDLEPLGQVRWNG